jgi:hypothetical protein
MFVLDDQYAQSVFHRDHLCDARFLQTPTVQQPGLGAQVPLIGL